MDAHTTPALSIHEATDQGNYDVVHDWLKKDPALVDSRDDFQNTPLHRAVAAGHLPIVKLLLSHGANPCAENEDKYIPLRLIIWRVETTKQYNQIAKLLLKKGIAADQLTHLYRRKSLLHIASEEGYTEMVRLFLMHGADPNAVTSEGYTAWHVDHYRTVANYRSEMIATFLKHPNINPNILDAYGNTVIFGLIYEILNTELHKKECYTHRHVYPNDYQKAVHENDELVQCLKYFIFAGITLDEDGIRQACNQKVLGIAASADFYPQIKAIIDKTLTIKKKAEVKLQGFSPLIIRHFLLSSAENQKTFLQEINSLYFRPDKIRQAKDDTKMPGFFKIPKEIRDQILQGVKDHLLGDYNFPNLATPVTQVQDNLSENKTLSV